MMIRWNKAIPDSHLPSLQQLPSVTALAFGGPFWSDATMAVLKDARRLNTRLLWECGAVDRRGTETTSQPHAAYSPPSGGH